jgi:Ca2+/Na+ antiporter
VNDEIGMARSYLLGSLVANILLVIGLSLFLGNLCNLSDEQGNGIEQVFSPHILSDSIEMTALILIILFPAIVSRAYNPVFRAN